MLVTRVVPAPADLHRDRQLVAVDRPGILARFGPVLGVPGVLLRILRIGVDQLDDEVGIGPGGGGEEVRGQLTGHGQIVLQRCAYERQHVGPPIDEALVGSLPRPPVTGGIGG